jgi:hypothetical protein
MHSTGEQGVKVDKHHFTNTTTTTTTSLSGSEDPYTPNERQAYFQFYQQKVDHRILAQQDLRLL